MARGFKSKKSKQGKDAAACRRDRQQATAAVDNEVVAVGGAEPMVEELSTPATQSAARHREAHSPWPILCTRDLEYINAGRVANCRTYGS